MRRSTTGAPTAPMAMVSGYTISRPTIPTTSNPRRNHPISIVSDANLQVNTTNTARINPKKNSSPKPITPRSSTNVQQNFGPTKSLNINDGQNTISHYFQKNNLKFEHQVDEDYLQDKDFIKNSPKIQAPDIEDDALTLYSQIQKNAIVYNIFLNPIDKTTIWDHSPSSVPMTCNLTNTNDSTFYQAYQRSAVAIYTKLQTMDFNTGPVFKTLLDHERSSQDRYKVLYSM